MNTLRCQWAVAALGSLALSLLLFLMYHPPVTLDGILYLKTAAQFQQKGFMAALTEYSWPFYPILIAQLSTWFGMSLQSAAYLIDLFGLSLLGAGFVWVMNELGFSSTVQWIGIAVFLAFPQLNIMRQLPVLRDFAYCGFLFMSLGALSSYARTGKISMALLWSAFIGIASAFRIEGVLIAVALPLVLLFIPSGSLIQRSIRLGYCYLFPLLGGVALIILIGLGVIHTEHLGRVNHLLNFYPQLIQPLIEELSARVSILSSMFSYNYTQLAAYIALITSVALYVVIRCALTLGIAYTVFLSIAWLYRTPSMRREAQTVLVGFIILNALLLFAFVLHSYFLSFRYAMPLCLSLLVWVPAGIQTVWNQCRALRTSTPYPASLRLRSLQLARRLALPVLMVVFAGVAINGVYRVNYSKAYLVRAGRWLQGHAKGRVYSNSPQVLYYAQPGHYATLSDVVPYNPTRALLGEYKYLAIKLGHHHPARYQTWKRTLGLKPIKVFENPRRDRVVIFRSPYRNSALSPQASPA